MGKPDANVSMIPVAIGAAMHAVLWLGSAATLLYVAPAFIRIFEDFETELPQLTAIVVQLSMLARQLWYVLIPLAIFGILVDWFVMASLYRQRGGALIVWTILFAAIPLILAGAAIMALMMPLMSGIKALS